MDYSTGYNPTSEEDEKLPMDTFTIETLEEDDHPGNLSVETGESEHDQLPSVEAYKAANDIGGQRRRSKTFWLIAFGVVTLIVISITGIVAATNKKASPMDLTGRTKEVEEFLFDNGVSTMPQLKQVGSVQQLAAAFVADGDALQMPLTTDNAQRFVERYVLTLIYFNFGGPEWAYNLKFLSGKDHCEWFDDFKNQKGDIIRMGVQCNENGLVQVLDLAWNNLRGFQEMPREIGYLAELETLDMYYNDLKGYFPESLRSLKKLKRVGLMKTGMIGTLPEWIGEMTQLTTLAVGDNHLHGEIPTSIDNLRGLRILGLDGNGGLSGSIEPLKQLSNLEALYLESNTLTGNLHSFNWPKLVELDVSNNELDGSVPVELFNHANLQVLDIHGNMMFGSFPDDIFQNTKLEYLAAQKTGFSGTVPDRLAFLSSLKHLDISFNGFTGTITDTLTQMTGLKYLATSGNLFSAQPMMNLSKLTNLVDLSMKSNNLVGSIPDEIGSLSNLELLDLDSNNLTGAIPTWIGLLAKLDVLLLNRNKLTGTIPSQLRNMKQLQVLLLDGNSIRGNAKVVCDSVTPNVFTADCYPGQNGEEPEVRCSCCTQCCTDGDTACNDKKWTSDVDPSYEHGWVRSSYTFNLENAPAQYANTNDANLR